MDAPRKPSVPNSVPEARQVAESEGEFESSSQKPSDWPSVPAVSRYIPFLTFPNPVTESANFLDVGLLPEAPPAMPASLPSEESERLVQVVLSPEHLTDEDDQAVQTLMVPPYEGSAPVTFRITPSAKEQQRLVVDFYHQHRIVGTTAFPVPVMGSAFFGPPVSEVPLPIVDLAVSSVPPADLELRIILSGDRRRLHFILHSPHEELKYQWKPAGERDLKSEPRQWTEGLFKDAGLGHQVTPGERKDFTLEVMSRVGGTIYEALFPVGLKFELRRIGGLIREGRVRSLIITSDESWIPWELVKLPASGESSVGVDDFLAAQVALGRWLAGDGLPGDVTVRAVQIVTPNWDDSSSSGFVGMAEREYLLTLPHREASVSVKVRRPTAEMGQVLAKLKNGGTQLYHLIAVGGVVYNDHQISLQLGDGAIGRLDAQTADGVRRSRPLIFLSNHCIKTGRPAWTGLGAWAEEFVRAGAAAFVGTWWEVRDEAAASFTEAFYDALWQGETLGEAFLKGRLRVVRSLPDSPDWLAFALWGDPNGRVLLDRDPWAVAQHGGDPWGVDKMDERPVAQSTGPVINGAAAISSGTPVEYAPDRGPSQTSPPPSTETVSESFTISPEILPLDARIWLVVADPKEEKGWDTIFEGTWRLLKIQGFDYGRMAKGDMVLACSLPPTHELVGMARVKRDYSGPGGSSGPWVQKPVRFKKPLSLDELRELTPGLACLKHPEYPLSPVTPLEWDIIRHALVERNPDAAGRLPSANPEVRPALKVDIQAAPTARVLKGSLSANLTVFNTGNVTFRRDEPLRIDFRCLDKSEKGEKVALEGKTQWRLGDDLQPERETRADVSLKSPTERMGDYIVEWAVSSEVWRDMMPAQAGRLAVAWSWGLKMREPEGEMEARVVSAGRSLAPRIQIDNVGSLPFSSEDQLVVALSWADVEGRAAETYHRVAEIPIGIDLAPGASIVWTLPEIGAPREPGRYKLVAGLLDEDLHEIDSISLDFTVTETPPAFSARIELAKPLPPSMWPGERFDVAVRVLNSGAERWGDRQIQIRRTVEPGDDEGPGGKRHSFHWVPATEPGTAVDIPFSCEAPLASGDHTLSVVLGIQEPLSRETSPSDLPRIAAAFSVVDLTRLSLEELREKAPEDITTEGGALRLRQMGERLKDEALTEQGVGSHVAQQLLEHLFSDSVLLCRSAVETLADLSSRDPSLRERFKEAIAARGDDLGRLPGRRNDNHLSDAARAWLHTVTDPPKVRTRQDEQGRLIIELGRSAASLPDYQPPDIRAVVKIDPEQIVLTCGNDTYISENLLKEPAAQGRLALQEAVSARAYGEELFGAVFNTKRAGGQGPTYDGYVIARKKASHRLCMELQIDPEAGSYKWEYLCNPNERVEGQPAPPLAVYADAPFYRRHGDNQDDAVDAGPLRILVAVCNPVNLGKEEHDGEKVPPYIAGLTPLQADAEIKVLERGLERLKREVKADYQFLGKPGDDPVTFQRLMEALKDGFHVLHIVGHGIMVNNKYYLLMEDNRRRSEPISPDKFQSPGFRQHLRLIVLASCQSARREKEAQRYLPSLAERLVKQGVRAVVAMQDVVSIEAAQLFSQCFYDDLARTGRIDMAMASARFSLYRHKPQWWDWGMPVLFMSTSDGALFKVDERLSSRAADTRMELQELEKMVEPAAKLLNEQELASRVLRNSISSQLQGAYPDPELIARLQAAILPSSGVIPTRVPPLAKRQARAALHTLKAVDFVGGRLAAHVERECKMRICGRVLDQVASALNSGKHIVLTGPPGTGKTTLAEGICSYAQNEVRCAPGYTMVTATSDWTTFDTVGGLMPVQGGTLHFKPGRLLQAIADGSWVIIDEINRAEIDKAFGELFTVLSGQQVELVHRVEDQPVRIMPGRREGSWDRAASLEGYDYVVHPSWRIIGTMNVYDKSYLFNMSFAFMRRFAFIDVDLPDEAEYRRLVEQWLDDFNLPKDRPKLPGSTDPARLIDWLYSLILRETALMRRRAVGPAFLQDVLRYMGNRLKADGRQASDYVAQPDQTDLLQYLAEAFQLYISPQLDGLDRQSIKAIYREVGDLFKPLQDSETEDSKELYFQTLRRIEQLYPHFSIEEWSEAVREQSTHPQEP